MPFKIKPVRYQVKNLILMLIYNYIVNVIVNIVEIWVRSPASEAIGIVPSKGDTCGGKAGFIIL
jgi:hypothetical protein